MAGVIAACGAIAWAFGGVSLTRVFALVSGIGVLGVALLGMPQLASIALETWGWRLAFPLEKIRFLSLLRVRVATESAAILPAGVVLAESLKVPLLVKACSFHLPSAIAAIVARKYLLLTSQSAYILLGATLGFGTLALASQALTGNHALPFGLLAFGVVVGGAGLGVRLLLSRGRVAAWLRRTLDRLPVKALRRALARHAAAFVETDGQLERFFALGARREALVTSFFFLGWVFESVETFVILRLLGVELGFFEVASFEVGLSLLRSLVFVVPAGIGIQDAGYVLFLRALGVPNAVDAGAAFALLKRGKELSWAALGFSLLGSELRASAAAGERSPAAGLTP